MKLHQETVALAARGAGLHDVTAQIRSVVGASGVSPTA